MKLDSLHSLAKLLLTACLLMVAAPHTVLAKSWYLSEDFYVVDTYEKQSMSGDPSLPAPSWYGDPNTTWQSYLFATDSTTALPEDYKNPYGVPTMNITVVPSGGVGTGYQDPSIPWQIHRDGGGWDLGPDGFVRFDIPVAPPVGTGPGYILDVYLGVVYEPTAGFYSPPAVDLLPSSLVTTDLNSRYEQAGSFFWGLATNVATINNLQSDFITVFVNAQGSTGSLIDAVEIHTRYVVIPEPRTYALAAGLIIFALAWHQRRCRKGT
jgi:hypothetical protein